jgi:3-oxoadipate enol-lactonase
VVTHARPNLKHQVDQGTSALRSYYIGGNEEAFASILFLNGLYHGHRAWVQQRRHPALQAFRHIFIDYRGVGDSRPLNDGDISFDDLVDDIAAVCAHIGTSAVVPVGFSVGGMIAMRLTERYPAIVKRLIILNSGQTVGPQAKSMISGAMQLFRSGVTGPALFQMLYPWNHSGR